MGFQTPPDRKFVMTVTTNGYESNETYPSPHWIRLGFCPDWLHAFSQNFPKIGSNVSVFLILGYKNSRPMFPLSLRLVLTSHYTITFASIVQSYSSILLVSRANIMVLQYKISIVLLLSAANFFQVTSLPLPAPHPQWVHVQWSSIIDLTLSL
jgi:hypothetical protein